MIPHDMGSTPKSKDDIEIPDHWRPEIEGCIIDKRFSSSSRNEIVRILVSQLFCRTTKPTRVQCENLARKFILKYPFAKDDLGNGYVSDHVCILKYFHGICLTML